MKNEWKPASQPQSAERAERSEASEALHYSYSLCMLPDAQECRNASSRSVRHLDAQKCSQTFINASRRSALPLDAQECLQMLRNASRRSGMHPDAQKDFHVLRIAQTPHASLCLASLSILAHFPFRCQDRFPKTQIPCMRSSLFGSPGASPYRPPFSMDFQFILDPQMDIKMDPKWYNF